MESLIISVGLGMILGVLGIINMTGNISSLHSYHRKRVSEEDRLPFGRLVGLGTLIIGVAIALYGLLTYLAAVRQIALFEILGFFILIPAILVGVGLNLYAMIKYNKGIF